MSSRPTSAGLSRSQSRPLSATRSNWSATRSDLELDRSASRPTSAYRTFASTSHTLDATHGKLSVKTAAAKLSIDVNAPAHGALGGPDVQPPGAEVQQKYLADHPHDAARLEKKGKRYPAFLYDNDPRSGKEKVFVNGFEQERQIGNPPHTAGQVKHEKSFPRSGSTVSGPGGKSFHGPGGHAGAPDPWSFTKRLMQKGLVAPSALAA